MWPCGHEQRRRHVEPSHRGALTPRPQSFYPGNGVEKEPRQFFSQDLPGPDCKTQQTRLQGVLRVAPECRPFEVPLSSRRIRGAKVTR